MTQNNCTYKCMYIDAYIRMIFDLSLVPKCSKSCWFHISYPKRVWTCMIQSCWLHSWLSAGSCRRTIRRRLANLVQAKSLRAKLDRKKVMLGDPKRIEIRRNPKREYRIRQRPPKTSPRNRLHPQLRHWNSRWRRSSGASAIENWAATIWRAILGCHFWNFRLHFRALVFYGNKAQIKFAKYHESKKIELFFSPYSGCDLGYEATCVDHMWAEQSSMHANLHVEGF